MKLTEFEKYFISVHKVFNELNIPHWLIGSSLLGAYREKRIIKGDKEVNFGVFGNDLIKNIDKLAEHYQLVFAPSTFKHGGVYLVDKDYQGDLWDHPVGFSWIAPHFRSADKLCQTPISGNIFYWNLDTAIPLSQTNFLGETFSVPRDPIKWFEEYFGDDWKIPNPDWHWLKDAKNIINVEALC